jgi:hypothetical protein
LLDSLIAEPLGQVSASIYETARLVALAPWLTGHAERIAFLLESQRGDGGWGGPDRYGLVPTLSATDALLHLALADDGRAPAAELVDSICRSAGAGLHAALGCLERSDRSLPDMPAIELIVPALVASINSTLNELSARPNARLASTPRLGLPAGMSAAPVHAFRARLRTGTYLHAKSLHALEVAGIDAARASGARPGASGGVGASPAATAAWLGPVPPPSSDRSRQWLERIIARTGGPVPCAVPITVFERGWVLAALSRNRVAVGAPIELLQSLLGALGREGASGGEGLPADADSTSVALFALARHGLRVPPECLRRFEGPSHFHTWPGEQGASTTVNAHVLEALHATGPNAEHGHAPAIDIRAASNKIKVWLCERQESDGRWTDRWHASAYYATSSCVLALHRVARGQNEPMVDRALNRAVGWVLESQRADGSWGTWGGTVEETAYAVQVLAHARPDRTATVERWDEAAARGVEFLSVSKAAMTGVPMWHDKDLYFPSAIVRAEVLGATNCARSPQLRAAARRTCPA